MTCLACTCSERRVRGPGTLIATDDLPCMHLLTTARTLAGQARTSSYVLGQSGNLLKRSFGEVPNGSASQRRRALGYASKLQATVHDVQHGPPGLSSGCQCGAAGGVGSRRSHPSSPVSAAAGRIFGPEKAKKHTKNTHKIKIKSKLNQNQLWDTVAHVGALHLSQATALRPVDAVVVPNPSKRKENEIKPLVSTSKPLSTVQSHHFRNRYSPTTSECIAARAWRSAASLTAHVVMMRRL